MMIGGLNYRRTKEIRISGCQSRTTKDISNALDETSDYYRLKESVLFTRIGQSNTIETFLLTVSATDETLILLSSQSGSEGSSWSIKGANIRERKGQTTLRSHLSNQIQHVPRYFCCYRCCGSRPHQPSHRRRGWNW